MRYVVARYNIYQRDTAYRIYVTDCLRIISHNTGDYMERRYIDILGSGEEDSREPEEIIADVIKKLGLEVKE